jgi:hypothetical protein
MNDIGVCCIDMGNNNIISQVELSKFEIEQVSIRSYKPLDAVVTALESAIGHPDMSEFVKATKDAPTFAKLESVVDSALGRLD